jgi:hypothetical protein
MINEFEGTFLTNIRKAIIDIFKADTFITEKLFDSVKNEYAISERALSQKSITRPYYMAVHHLCEEEIIDNGNELDNQGIELIQGNIYIDFARKLNRKDGNIFDEVDKFAWSGITTLRQASPDLNSNVLFWKFAGKRLWIAEDSEIENPNQTLILETKLKVYYSHVYSRINEL